MTDYVSVCLLPVHFITSFLWAPPVATQFSVLSQTFVKVRAPPVATLLFHLISSHRFSGHHLWRHSFLFFGHRRWRPFCHFLPPHHICGHRLWRLSFLFCHAVCCVFGHYQLRLGSQNYDQGGRITTREAELRPGRQNYDQGGRITTREAWC